MFSLLLCLPVSSNFINLNILFLLANLTKFCQSHLSFPRTNLHVIASSECTVGNMSLVLPFLPWFQLFFLSTASVWFVLVFPNLLSALLNYLFEVHLIVNVSTQSNEFPFKTFFILSQRFSKLCFHFYLIPRHFLFLS